MNKAIMLTNDHRKLYRYVDCRRRALDVLEELKRWYLNEHGTAMIMQMRGLVYCYELRDNGTWKCRVKEAVWRPVKTA